MSAETIMTLANQIFGWDIDFALDIREGDEFSVLYEQKFQDGDYVNDGRVLAAEFVNQGKTHRAVWFESQDGEVQGYFTPEGKGMRKAFLRAPLDFTRISSGFNPRRRAPDQRHRARAQGHRLRGADRHADLGRRRRPHRVRRPQGRLRQRRDHRPRQGHQHAVRPHVALRQVGARRPPACKQGDIDRLRRHRPARRPARTCTTNTGSRACTRTRRRSRCRAPKSRRSYAGGVPRPERDRAREARAHQRPGHRPRGRRQAADARACAAPRSARCASAHRAA